MIYEKLFLVSLVITIIIEVPIALLLVKKIFKTKIKFSRIIIVTIIASSLTLPYVWFIFPIFSSDRMYIVISEIFAIVIESLIYNSFLELRLDKSLLIAVIANTISFFIGLGVLKLLPF